MKCEICGREVSFHGNQKYCSDCAPKAPSIRRGYGYIPLNEPFEGSQGHHLDKDRVVYIPKELHRIVPHDVKSGRNMEIINVLALSYLSLMAKISARKRCGILSP